MADHHNFGPGEWPFPDAVNTGVYATVQVMEGSPILLVSHDHDADWQFLHATDLTDENDAGDLRYVCLGCLFERHPYVSVVADLPYGWQASRRSVSSPWRRGELPPDQEE